MRFGKGVGVLSKGIGSGSPAFVLEDAGDADEAPHPFLVTVHKSGGSWHFKVVPGTVNSLVPILGSSTLDSLPSPTGSIGSVSGYVYLECKYTEGEAFPVAADLKVQYDTAVPADTDTMSHVALAYIDYTGTFPRKTAQFVRTSLWGERLKCGDNPAEYFYTRA